MEKPLVQLEDWSVVTFLGEYDAPELRVICLHGIAYGHPGFPDGTEVTTSCLVGSQGRLAETHQTRYCLGEISPAYQAYLDRKGLVYDKDNPITVK